MTAYLYIMRLVDRLRCFLGRHRWRDSRLLSEATRERIATERMAQLWMQSAMDGETICLRRGSDGFYWPTESSRTIACTRCGAWKRVPA